MIAGGLNITLNYYVLLAKYIFNHKLPQKMP